MRVAPTIVLSDEERAKPTRLGKSKTASVRVARRAQMMLLAAAGKDNEAIAAELGIGRVQVGRWRTRYTKGGLAAIERDLPRGGRPPKVDAAEIVWLTTQTLPEAATHWSTRTMAAKASVSDTTVLRVELTRFRGRFAAWVTSGYPQARARAPGNTPFRAFWRIIVHPEFTQSMLH